MTPPTAAPGDQADLIQLRAEVAAATRELTEALKVYGEHSREARNAEYLLRVSTRKLESAEFRAKESERQAALSPREIADEVLGDR